MNTHRQPCTCVRCRYALRVADNVRRHRRYTTPEQPPQVAGDRHLDTLYAREEITARMGRA